MGTLFAYSIGITIPLFAMYAIYKWLLARTTLYRFNRAVLLSVYFVTLIILPSMQLLSPISSPNAITEAISTDTTTIENIDATSARFPAMTIALYIYIAGMVLMLLRAVTGIIRILTIVMKNERIKLDKFTIILHDNDQIVPFSWGKWIVMNRTDYADSRNYIITHEQAHLTARHWVDLLFAEVVTAINWFNPAAWLLRNELQDLHEFEADDIVLKSNANNYEDYQIFLIKKTAGTRFAAIANSLNHSSIKKRITMMLQKKSQSKARMRALALVPVVALSLVFVNNPMVAATLSTVASTPTEIGLPDKDSKKSPVNTEMCTVSGVVIDTAGEPVIGAIVKVVDGKAGTVTDKNGKFEIKVPKNSGLQVLYFGYTKKNIQVGNNDTQTVKVSLQKEQ